MELHPAYYNSWLESGSKIKTKIGLMGIIVICEIPFYK